MLLVALRDCFQVNKQIKTHMEHIECVWICSVPFVLRVPSVGIRCVRPPPPSEKPIFFNGQRCARLSLFIARRMRVFEDGANSVEGHTPKYTRTESDTAVHLPHPYFSPWTAHEFISHGSSCCDSAVLFCSGCFARQSMRTTSA